MSEVKRLILPNRNEITDPEEMQRFEQVANTPNPTAIHRLEALKFPPEKFEFVNGVVAVYEETDNKGRVERTNVLRAPDVIVTQLQNHAQPSSVYYYVVRPDTGRSILIQLLTTSELKTVVKSLKVAPSRELKQKLQARKMALIHEHQQYLSSYFKNRRD